MKVYSAFGYFKPDKTSTLEICLPVPVSTPSDLYKYEFVNISNSTTDGLLIFVKKNVDLGSSFVPCCLDYQTVPLDLSSVPLFTDTGMLATNFTFSKNIAIIVHHEANTSIYNSVGKQFFQSLNTIIATGAISLTANSIASGPSKTGTGAIKKT